MIKRQFTNKEKLKEHIENYCFDQLTIEDLKNRYQTLLFSNWEELINHISNYCELDNSSNIGECEKLKNIMINNDIPSKSGSIYCLGKIKNYKITRYYNNNWLYWLLEWK